MAEGRRAVGDVTTAANPGRGAAGEGSLPITTPDLGIAAPSTASIVGGWPTSTST
jgi:hypothetical protein